MTEEIKKTLQEAEVQHEKLIVLHAQTNEQLNKIKLENEKIVHLLTASKGQIEAYRKTLQIIEQYKE